MEEMGLEVGAGKEVGGWKNGRPWVCSVQTLLKQERYWEPLVALPAGIIFEKLSQDWSPRTGGVYPSKYDIYLDRFLYPSVVEDTFFNYSIQSFGWFVFKSFFF